MFRGPNATGVSEGYPLPVRWDTERGINVEWKVDIPGLGLSSPAVWEKYLFITTATSGKNFNHRGLHVTREDLAAGTDMKPLIDETHHEWWLYCLDKRTGHTVWKKLVHAGAPRSRRHPQNSYATPTVAVDGKHVLAMFGSEGLYCFDLEGNLLWKRDFEPLGIGSYEDRQYQWGYASSPILYDHLAIIQCDVDRNPFVAAFDVRSGEEVWRVARTDLPSWSTPVVQERWGFPPHLIVQAPFNIIGYSVFTGEEIWRLYWGMDITESTPVVYSDMVFVSSGKGAKSPIYAVHNNPAGDITLKTGDMKNEFIAWNTVKGGPVTVSTLVYRRHYYALTDFGVLRCYVPQTGKLLYEERIPAAFQASPVAGDGKIYLCGLEGDIFVVKAGLEFELLARNSIQEMLQATPAISENRLFIRTRRSLYCIRENTNPAAAPGTEMPGYTP